MHISVMPSALGTSSFIPNLFCEMFTSGVTSHPFRLTLRTGNAPMFASSAVLYILRCKSRHVNQYRLNAFKVNILGLEKIVNYNIFISLYFILMDRHSLQESQVITQLWCMRYIVYIVWWLESFKCNLKV